MFNKDFYPTPSEVISEMLYGIDITGKIILEPSAGKGNIVDYMNANGAKQVIACEINRDMARILSGKCRLIADDFLTLTSVDVSHIDMIVMNPPFSADETHILHAWNIAPAGCQIISLCNSSMVLNSSTRKQQEISALINQHGRTLDFGQCFENAERKTSVGVSCIYLNKPAANEEEFAGYFSYDEETAYEQEGVVRYNYVRDIVSRYVGAVKMWDKVVPLSNELNALTAPISEYGIKFGAFRTGERSYRSEISRDEFKKELQKSAWMKVFSDMKMDKYITRGVKEKINEFVEKQTEIPFTVKNVYKMVETIVGTHSDRMQKVLLEAFDLICGFAWKDNCTGGEYWKTNSDYMVNRRFIIPYICESDFYGTKRETVRISTDSRNAKDVEDIIKALCNLTGRDYNTLQNLNSFTYNIQGDKEDNGQFKFKGTPMEWGKWYDWEFFRIRGYKKGTMHFEFREEEVWTLFNQQVARIKGWRIPENVKGKKR